MRVCLVNSFYPPYIGGAESYVSNLARSLAKRGHQVTVYCAARPLSPGVGHDAWGVRVIRMRTPLTFYGTPISAFPSSFLTEDADIIHCNFPNPYFSLISALVARARGRPAVLTWHNDLPPPTRASSLLVSLHDRLLSPIYLDCYDRIIATTSAYARSSPTLRRNWRKVRVIPNGVDTRKFNPAVNGRSIRERYGLRGRKVVLFVGALTRWHTYKGLHVLLRAFVDVRRTREDAMLLVVGDGEMRSYYMALAAKLGIDSATIFTGRVGDDELPQHYAASDILVLPSLDSSEGFGIVLLEAMATGRAVIGTRVGGVVEAIREGWNGLLVEPSDPKGLAEAIITLLEQDEEREKMGMRGRAFAEMHDWSRIAERVEHLYREVLSH